MKTYRLLLPILFLCAIQIFGQGYSISPKYTFVTNNKYTSREFFINFSYEIKSVNLVVGLDFGYLNMFYDDYNWKSVIGHESKGFIGIGLNYLLWGKIAKRITPYFGVKTLLISDRHFSLSTGGNMYFDDGYYFPKSKNDKAYSVLIGNILVLESFNLIMEAGYEFRKFTFTYDEFVWTDDNMDLINIKHSEEKTFNSFIATLGIQFEL